MIPPFLDFYVRHVVYTNADSNYNTVGSIEYYMIDKTALRTFTFLYAAVDRNRNHFVEIPMAL